VYDCVACGRCCFHRPNHVQLYAEDLVRLGPVKVAELTELSTLPKGQRPPDEDDDTRFMKVRDGHCIALHTEPNNYPCTIYQQRPLRCEVYAPGSPSCLIARARPTQALY
jgi:Fe-S-cluster containining protein